MTATMTTREQMEKLAADMRSVADEADKAGSVEGQAQLITMAQEFAALRKQYESEKAARNGLSDVTTYIASLAEAPDTAIKNLADVTASNSHEEKTPDGRPVNPKGRTLGELFTMSDAFKSLDRWKNLEGVIPHNAKSISSVPFQVDVKDIITGTSSTSAGAAVRNDMYAPITDLIGQRDLTVADLVTRGQTTSDTVEFVRVTGKTNNASPVVEASATSGTSGTKPESAMTLEVVSTTVKTIAHWIPITKRAASDAPQVRTMVDSFLRYGLEEELEDQILNGSGTGENFTGILNTAGISTVGSAGTDIDAIVDAIRTIRNDRRRPNAVVFHPNDWYSTGFLLAKDLNNNYLIGDPRASLDQLMTLWGLRVVVTEAMTENTALVGEFRQAVLWEREGVTLSVTDSHSDFFVRNLLVILAEMRAAFGVLDVDSFCTVTAI